MLPFRASHGATVSYDVDFSVESWVNLYFLDAERATIPFHISLRREGGRVVLNRRDTKGWRREVTFDNVFRDLPVSVVLEFTPRRVAVWIAGRLLARVDAFPRPDRAGRLLLRRGFPDLVAIAQIEVEGALVPDSLRIDCPAAVASFAGVPTLTDTLEVVCEGLTPRQLTEGQGTRLRVAGFDTPLLAVARRTPYVQPGHAPTRLATLVAVVPGRVWLDAGDALTMTLQGHDGAVVGATTLTRAALVATLERLATTGIWATDDRAALQAVEHVRYAGVLSHLSVTARNALFAAADRFRLAGFLLDGQPEGPGPEAQPALIAAADRVDVEAMALRDRFTTSLRDDPGADPIARLDALLRADDLSGAVRKAVLGGLTDWFCLHDKMGDLARYWRGQRLAFPGMQPDDAPWALSARLPLAYAEGRFGDVAWALRSLARPNPGWVSTACLGWVMAQIAAGAPAMNGRAPSPAARRAMARGALRWLLAWSRVYWGRTHCVVILRAVAGALMPGVGMPGVGMPKARLTTAQQAVLARLALRLYALSPAFWDAVEGARTDAGCDMPASLAAAAQAFAALSTAMQDPFTPQSRARMDALLRRFHGWRAVDIPRFRRDLFGPAGVDVADGTAPDLAQCRAVGLSAPEAALRYLAAPLTPQTTPAPAALQSAAIGALRRADPRIIHAEFHDQQAAAFGLVMPLLAAPDARRLADVLALIQTLADGRCRFLGLGLGVSLVNALIAQGRLDEAAQVAACVCGSVAAVTQYQSRAYLDSCPAPGLALAALHRAHPDHPLTQQVLSALSPAFGPVAAWEPAVEALDQPQHPILDTVVCLYTCRANLDTRIAVIRAGWLRLLADMGVPCLVFVGDGDGQREGDVVYLDAPDDYEGLPQKTLAMARWVHENTRFSWLVKVDDDCFVDPQAFLGDLTFQKYDYYGRPLTRYRGEMDRTWHMAKSKTARGRLELDKSPEPSTYGDGGSGYVLSRRAMAALIDAEASPEGQDLIQQSFMEDKLVGDLLALRAIAISGEAYHVTLLRRRHAAGPLLAVWDNYFLPFKGAGIKLAHLDGSEKQAEVQANSRDPWPKDRKIWPTYQPVRSGWESNTLDLISSPQKLARVNEAPVAVVASLRNEGFMIDRFLEHYRGLGVQGFLIADNGSDDGSFERLADQPDVALFAVDTNYSASQYGVAWQQALLGGFRTGRWSLVADADEFLFWNTDLSGSLPDLVAEFDAEGATAARVFMLDMYPQGPLSDAEFRAEGPFAQAGFVDRDPFQAVLGGRGVFSDSQVWTSALRHRLLPGSRSDLFVAQKYAVLKYQPWMRPSAGLHFVANTRVADRELFFGHFKYNAAFRAKAQAEVARKQHFNNAEEYSKYLTLIFEGRDRVYDPAFSVRWQDCAFVRDRCR